jgi:hypothetical protein
MNGRGANDAYRTQQREYGTWLAANGLNSPFHVLRLDWEFNGNWYPWSAKDAQAFRLAVTHYVDNVRAGGATKVGFDVCGNKGPSQAGHDFDAIPGPAYVRVRSGRPRSTAAQAWRPSAPRPPSGASCGRWTRAATRGTRRPAGKITRSTGRSCGSSLTRTRRGARGTARTTTTGRRRS